MSGKNALGHRLREMVFHQSDAAERVALCRLVTGAAVIRTVWHLPPGDFVAEYGELLDRAQGRTPRSRTYSPAAYESLRAIAVASTAAWALGVEHPAVKLAANASFAVVQWQVVDFHDKAWSYNSHLNVFLAALSVLDSRSAAAMPDTNREFASVVLFAMQACFSWVYLQSGVSKLVAVGWRWADGRTLRGVLGELGTSLGKWLAITDPRLSRAASTATLVFELGFVPLLLLGWRHRGLLGAGSAAFHVAVKATMGISFWHLSWFSAPLFVLPEGAVEWLSRRVYPNVRWRGTDRAMVKSLTRWEKRVR